MRRLSLLAVAALFFSGCGGTEEMPEKTDPCAGATSGTACSWAGLKGESGFNGDGNPRWLTRLNGSQDILFLGDGTVFFSDFNNYLVRKVTADDKVKSVVGWTDPVFPGDGPFGGIKPGGADGADWQLNHPTSLLLDKDGTIILVAWHNHKLLRIDPATGWVTVIAGGGAGYAGDGGPAAMSLLRQPVDATIDDDGNIYIVDQANQRIRRIGADGMMSTIAGTGMPGYMDGPGAMAQFKWAGGSNPNPSGSITYNDGKLYISDTENNRIRALEIATGTVSTFAGTGEKGFSGDGGPAASAQLSGPRDLEIGPEGDLYFADTDNGAVRAIDLTTNVIRTVVGLGELGLDEGERLPATDMHLRRPFGIAFDPDGNLYVMDSLNDRIVKVMK